MERFSSCWADEDKPYLQPLPDTPGHVEGERCFCNTSDRDILGQVLNNYDQETADFYRWTVEYSREEISGIICRRSGCDIGLLESLTPVDRGPSGRIVKLEIKGAAKTIVVGKELEIRRLLSESHLKSSAFDVEYIDQYGRPAASSDMWSRIRINGAGWGHGVGLCQIGAAVMASEGYTYREILEHYYPGTEL